MTLLEQITVLLEQITVLLEQITVLLFLVSLLSVLLWFRGVLKKIGFYEQRLREIERLLNITRKK